MHRFSLLFRAALFLCLTVAAISCEKETLNSTTSSQLRPVVEGYLHADRVATIKVSRQLLFEADSNTNTAITDAQIWLTTGTDTLWLAHTSAGIYQSTDSIAAGTSYSLHLLYNGELYQAETVVPQQPQSFTASAEQFEVPVFGGGTGGPPAFPDPIELNWENTDGSYYLVVVENTETDPVALFSGDRPPPNFRTEPEQIASYELGFQSFGYYGQHRVILFRINAEYASLYDDNGNSSQNLTTPFTNITNGGLGIFTGIHSDTLWVEVE